MRGFRAECVKLLQLEGMVMARESHRDDEVSLEDKRDKGIADSGGE